MGYYMYKAIPPRPTFGADITEAEAAIMGQHVAYWTELLGKGVAVVFGPVADPAGLFGMAVVEAQDEEEVRALAADDPAISASLLSYEVFTMPRAIARPGRGPSRERAHLAEGER